MALVQAYANKVRSYLFYIENLIFYLLLVNVYQFSQEWEVIIVDDGSPDGTQECAKQLQKIYGSDKIVCTHQTKLKIFGVNELFPINTYFRYWLLARKS